MTMCLKVNPCRKTTRHLKWRDGWLSAWKVVKVHRDGTVTSLHMDEKWYAGIRKAKPHVNYWQRWPWPDPKEVGGEVHDGAIHAWTRREDAIEMADCLNREAALEAGVWATVMKVKIHQAARVWFGTANLFVKTWDYYRLPSVAATEVFVAPEEMERVRGEATCID